MKFTKISGEPLLYQIDELFSEKECERLIITANAVHTGELHQHDKAWHPVDTGGDYHRVVMVSEKLAEELWIKLQPILGQLDDLPYELVKINDHFRYSRYHPGGEFPIHCDKKNYMASRDHPYDLESLFTLNIFLNEDFEGGATDFFVEGPNGKELRASLKPKAGRAGLFWADQHHRGSEVTPGTRTKYLLRTDVMGILK